MGGLSSRQFLVASALAVAGLLVLSADGKTEDAKSFYAGKTKVTANPDFERLRTLYGFQESHIDALPRFRTYKSQVKARSSAQARKGVEGPRSDFHEWKVWLSQYHGGARVVRRPGGGVPDRAGPARRHRPL